ncbi:response regulator transcription factor [Symbioplanes lichenis]|uniref:response regulator transcription factor n=1 Tax=Symbioplanes lichenis TaxID=1629072 RepID=UPI0027382525|nr:response regulator transcription factor [Actinoplanes lichenis]
MSAHVLVAEDDVKHAEILRRCLESAGHRATVAHDGPTALATARRVRPDLVLLDVMLPGLDGIELCGILRRESAVPVLMLTARTSEDDLLLGLAQGADDYLTKPYRPRELLARIQTLLRRTRPVAVDLLRAGPVTVALDTREVRAGDRLVECTPDEFAILVAMMRRPERVFTRAALLEQTSGGGKESTERTIDTHISNLRRKLEPNPRRPVLLLTVYGVGYKMAGAG